MRKSNFFLICLLLGSLLSAGCYYQKPDYSDEWDLTEKRKDSLDFEASHHYNRNYNFVVVGDSLCLQTVHPVHNPVHAGVPEDTVAVFADDRLVVAEVMIVPEDSVDSVWVKVARDQSTMGWVHEQDLLARVVPDDSISRFIHTFSNTHLIYFLSVLGVLSVLWLVRRMRRKRFHIVHFDDIGSCYPTLLCLTLSGAATLYASMQNFVPDTWTEFYFHPTLNPFGLPVYFGLVRGFRVADCHSGHSVGGRRLPATSLSGSHAVLVCLIRRMCRVLSLLFAHHVVLSRLSFFLVLRRLGVAALFPLCPLSLRLRTLRGQASQQGALPALRCME